MKVLPLKTINKFCANIELKQWKNYVISIYALKSQILWAVSKQKEDKRIGISVLSARSYLQNYFMNKGKWRGSFLSRENSRIHSITNIHPYVKMIKNMCIEKKKKRIKDCTDIPNRTDCSIVADVFLFPYNQASKALTDNG